MPFSPPLCPEHLCPECRLPKEFCFCDRIPQITTNTWISLVIHIAEVGCISNTGTPLVRAVHNSDSSVIGKVGTPKFNGVPKREGRTQVLLFPEPSAKPIDEFKERQGDNPVQLVILDGTWSQTRRMMHRYPALYSLPKVALPSYTSNYILRKSPHEGGLCTIEAAAYALKILEGDHVSDPLLSLLDIIKESVFKCNPVRKYF